MPFSNWNFILKGSKFNADISMIKTFIIIKHKKVQKSAKNHLFPGLIYIKKVKMKEVGAKNCQFEE